MRQQLFLAKREAAWQELAHTLSVSDLQTGKYPWQHWEGCDESSVSLVSECIWTLKPGALYIQEMCFGKKHISRHSFKLIKETELK